MPSQPQPDEFNDMGGAPFMDGDMGNGGFPEDGMGGGPEYDVEMGDGEEDATNPFNSNFDAGVEADENEDPKKFIQQLTGKLSQSLRQYNSELPQPDVDLDKYVLGMVIKQATEGMSQNDINDVLSNLKDGDKKDDGDDKGTEETEPDMQSEPDTEEQADMGEPDGGMQESRVYRINELFNDVIGNDDIDAPTVNSGGFRKKPFISPDFN